MTAENITAPELYTACEATLGMIGAPILTCLDFVIAATDFNSFLELIYDFAGPTETIEPVSCVTCHFSVIMTVFLILCQ